MFHLPHESKLDRKRQGGEWPWASDSGIDSAPTHPPTQPSPPWPHRDFSCAEAREKRTLSRGHFCVLDSIPSQWQPHGWFCVGSFADGVALGTANRVASGETTPSWAGVDRDLGERSTGSADCKRNCEGALLDPPPPPPLPAFTPSTRTPHRAP
jgi:hypothetical protein